MTTGLTYSTYKTQIATMAVVEESDPAFVTVLPQAITYAENRLYRDLDFLFTSASNSSYYVDANTRTLTVPQGVNFSPSDPFGGGVLVVAEQLNVLTPAGNVNPDSSTRVPLLPATKEFLDVVYGSSATIGVPKYFAPFNDNLFLVGPYADQRYYVEIVGTYRPASLSATQTTTFISLYLPDLFVMASMIYVSAYQRNFTSASGNDPQMPVTYETQYSTLLKSAAVEEARKKFEGSAWSSQSPTQFATPGR